MQHTDEVTIRRFEDRDLEGLFVMIRKAFLTPVLDKVYEAHVKDFWLSEYSPEELRKLAKTRHLYVAELAGEIVGSGAVHAEDGCAYISAVFIDPDRQGYGIGGKIMAVLEQDEISLQYRKLTLTAALSASGFYKKLGYTFKYDVPEIILDGILEVVYMEKDR